MSISNIYLLKKVFKHYSNMNTSRKYFLNQIKSQTIIKFAHPGTQNILKKMIYLKMNLIRYNLYCTMIRLPRQTLGDHRQNIKINARYYKIGNFPLSYQAVDYFTQTAILIEDHLQIRL